MGRRTKLLAIAAGALLAVPATAQADSVYGLGVTNFSAPNLFNVLASDQPPLDGGLVTFIAVDDNSKQIRGEVVCMTVSGNRAMIIYEDATTHPSGTVGGYVLMEDNGPAGVTPVDEQRNGRYAPQGLNRQVATGCPIPSLTTNPIANGEIIITDDAPPI